MTNCSFWVAKVSRADSLSGPCVFVAAEGEEEIAKKVSQRDVRMGPVSVSGRKEGNEYIFVFDDKEERVPI